MHAVLLVIAVSNHATGNTSWWRNARHGAAAVNAEASALIQRHMAAQAAVMPVLTATGFNVTRVYEASATWADVTRFFRAANFAWEDGVDAIVLDTHGGRTGGRVASHAQLPGELARAVQRMLGGAVAEWYGAPVVPMHPRDPPFIRCYHAGAALMEHVDAVDPPSGRAQFFGANALLAAERLDAPWPLTMRAPRRRQQQEEGSADELVPGDVVDLRPGDVVLYEAGRIRHARPWPLEGEPATAPQGDDAGARYCMLFSFYQPQTPFLGYDDVLLALSRAHASLRDEL
eukprot:g3609.t1